MTVAVLMTLFNIVCIMVCTDAMRAAWEAEHGWFFILATIGAALGAISLVLRVTNLTV